jgi:hypothetical protein
VDQQQLAEHFLAQANEAGIELMGPGGLLNQFTKNVLETALDAEISEWRNRPSAVVQTASFA